jgi:hypothetical protein
MTSRPRRHFHVGAPRELTRIEDQMQANPKLLSHIMQALDEIYTIQDATWHKNIPDRNRTNVRVDEIVQESKRAEIHLKAAMELLGETSATDMSSEPFRVARRKLKASARELDAKRGK